MKLETIEEWKKESIYLYKLLKAVHREATKMQIMTKTIRVPGETMDEMLDACWKVYCIEKNLKEEDYKI